LRPILIVKRAFDILLNENGVADHHVCLRGRCAADSGCDDGKSGQRLEAMHFPLLASPFPLIRTMLPK
jgi:hypothetical protein